jgi:Tfp pilus assembly protein PilF
MFVPKAYCAGIVLLAMIVALSGGCASQQTIGSSGSASAGARHPESIAERTAGEGIEALRSGRPEEAAAAFNRALALAPSQAELHLLAGLAYHLEFLSGTFPSGDLAETGYIVASQLDPSLLSANLQLARFYLDTKHYDRAQKFFVRVLEVEPDHIEALYGLAVTSYYGRDLETALGAVRLAKSLQPTDPRIMRAAAIVYAASGLESEASEARNQLAGIEAAHAELGFIDRRMTQWHALHVDSDLQLSQVSSGKPDKQDKASVDKTASKESGAKEEPTGPRAAYWADCKQKAIDPNDNSNSNSGYYSSSQQSSYYSSNQQSSDETSLLKALPSPCLGQQLPRMAVIDASIIRMEEIVSSSRGINLLDGLQVVFGWSNLITRTVTDGTTSNTHTSTNSIALPPAGVTYSLNIANAADVRNDVLARPSLVALDRQPSIFFSGTNITIVIPGQYGGDIEEKSIGISLSVTPTFVDDDTLLLAVKAARSDIEEGIPGTLAQALPTTRSSVTTNVLIRMDQTLVLSGLVEKESNINRSRTPLLGEVPGLQYLFGNATTEENRKSILVVLTPRRPAETNPPEDSASNPTDPRIVEVRKQMNPDLSMPPGTLSVIRSLSENRYLAQFRSGDLKADDWRTQESLNHLLRDLSSFLYF